MIRFRKDNKAITLVALVITIILLLILAGITITQLTGSGLFGKAKKAKIISDYTTAKEKIELELMSIQTECITEGKEYNIIEIEKGMEKVKDITIHNMYYSDTAKLKDGIELDINRKENLIGILVSVDKYSEYKFLIGKSGKIEKATKDEIPDKIDSEKLKPIDEFEKEVIGIIPSKDNNDETDIVINEDIKIILEKEIISEEDVKPNLYEFATIKATIEPINIINKVTINGKEIQVDNTTGKVNIDVTENGTYKIIAYGENKTYNYATAIVKDLSENLEIWTEEELVNFQKSVNSGRTYKDKTITLKKDLDIENIQWTPIGYYTSNDNYLAFKGTFDGENHTIKNLNINIMKSNEKYSYGVGFISVLEYGTLKNLNFSNPYVYTNANGTGIAVGWTENAVIENVKILDGEINKSGTNVGGITGHNNGIIRKCYNNANILVDNDGGGISGINGGTIEKCYNTGTINVGLVAGGISGVNVLINSNNIIIQDCYNTGNINSIGTRSDEGTGGIVGLILNASTIKNCYNSGNITTTATQTNIGGIIGRNIEDEKQVVQNVFNTGTIKCGNTIANPNILKGTSTPFIGTLIGRYGVLTGIYGSDVSEIPSMTYWDENAILTNLGESFKKNTNLNINKGLPILDWQVVK